MKNYRQLFVTLVASVVCLPVFARTEGKTAVPKPLSFIENKGQITDQAGRQRKDIDVKLQTPGMTVFVGDGVIHYQWYKQSGASTSPFAPGVIRSAHEIADAKLKGGMERQEETQTTVETYRMDVELVGANVNAEMELEEQQEYHENYYLPTYPDGAVAYSYNRMTYKNVYPGIDWVLYSKDNQLKYDFVVKAGADVSLIKLRYNGATAVEIINGEVIAATPFGTIKEAAPYSYYTSTKQPVSSAYKLDGIELSFDISGMGDEELVIDPSLNWGTYYGGLAGDIGHDVATDTAGNAYIAGETSSTSNIATSGVFQQSFGGNYDAFLAKFNIAGVLQWATYYGGTGFDQFYTIASEPNGTLYAGGEFRSAGLATAGAHQSGHGSNDPANFGDGLLARFDASGVRLWATYYGGTSYDAIEDIGLDGMGAVYICGGTQSSNNIATPGSFTPNYTYTNASMGGFLARFNTSGSRQWGTYYNDSTWLFAVTCDGLGNVYVGGNGVGTVGLTTPGCFQSAPGGPLSSNDGLLAKFTSSGTRLWATLYGGYFGDRIQSIATDAWGDVYIGGTTGGGTGLTTPGAHQTTFNGNAYEYDGLLAKFSSTGVRQWATYYSGSAPMGTTGDEVSSVTVSADNKLYIAGATHSTTGIATANGYQPAIGGQSDVFLAIFDLNGQRQYGTYYGGTGSEGSPGGGGDRNPEMAYSVKGKIYLTSVTESSSAIATPGAYQTTHAGGVDDAFLAQFQADTAVYIGNIGAIPQLLCKTDSLAIQVGNTHPFQTGNSFTVQLSDASGSFTSPINIGSLSGPNGGTIKLAIPVSVPDGAGYRVRIISSSPVKISGDNGFPIAIYAYPAKPVATVNNPLCTGDSLKLTATGTASAVWSWTGPAGFTASTQNTAIADVTLAAAGDYIVSANNNGCIRKDTVTAIVSLRPAKPVATNNSPICAGTTLNLTATTTTPGVSYSWSGPMSYSSTSQNPSIPAATPGHAGDYVVTASLANCHARDTTTAIVNSVSSLGAYASPNDTFCEGTLVSFVAVPFNGGTSPTFQWYKNGTLIPGATGMVCSTSSVVSGDSFYCRMMVVGICTDPLELYSPGIKVTVLPVTSTPFVTIASNPAIPQPGQNTTFTATATNGGPTPTFQWLRNGQHVIGATNAIWSASTLHPYDQISCVVFSSDVCANPKTDTSGIVVVNFPTSVKDVNSKSWQVYPNPATNELTIEGEAGMQVSILNVLGQEVYSGALRGDKEVVSISQFAAGSYLLQLTGSDGVRNVVKVEKL